MHRVVVMACARVGVLAGALVGCGSSTTVPSRDADRPPAAIASGDHVVADATPGSTSDAASDAATPTASDAAAPTASIDAGSATAPAVKIVDAPMVWSDERAALTLDYRRKHSDPAARDLVIDPRVIVLHYTAGGSAKGTRDYFDNLEIEAERKDLAKAGAVNVSSHFIVDRDGTIYRLQPETRFARHCIGMNHIAIGIENVGDESKWPLTDAQVVADAELIRDLVRRFPNITHVLGHYEVTTFHSSYYVERDTKYRNDKPDPGKRFMALVRDKIADLKLSGP